jgi:hypothetical protein
LSSTTKSWGFRDTLVQYSRITNSQGNQPEKGAPALSGAAIAGIVVGATAGVVFVTLAVLASMPPISFGGW